MEALWLASLLLKLAAGVPKLDVTQCEACDICAGFE